MVEQKEWLIKECFPADLFESLPVEDEYYSDAILVGSDEEILGHLDFEIYYKTEAYNIIQSTYLEEGSCDTRVNSAHVKGYLTTDDYDTEFSLSYTSSVGVYDIIINKEEEL